MRIHRSVLAAGVLLAAASVSRATMISYSYSGNVVQFMAPATSTYDFTAIGAAGGHGNREVGGLGASVQASYSLTVGQVVDILVGQAGGNGPGGGAGGGGATFVVLHGGNALLVAGGGGGGGDVATNGQNASALSVLTSGSGSGGTSSFNPDNGTGSGGGGLIGNGANGADPLFTQPTGGKSFQNGGAGGVGSTSPFETVAGNGGFGGGGGGSDVGAGGGGGFNGGNGGDASQNDGGNAGASFYNNTLGSLENYASAPAASNGSLSITFNTPEPNAAAATGLLLAGILFTSRRRLRPAT